MTSDFNSNQVTRTLTHHTPGSWHPLRGATADLRASALHVLRRPKAKHNMQAQRDFSPRPENSRRSSRFSVYLPYRKVHDAQWRAMLFCLSPAHGSRLRESNLGSINGIIEVGLCVANLKLILAVLADVLMLPWEPLLYIFMPVIRYVARGHQDFTKSWLIPKTERGNRFS